MSMTMWPSIAPITAPPASRPKSVHAPRKTTRLPVNAASVESTDGVIYVPAPLGLGTPNWDFGARGTLVVAACEEQGTAEQTGEAIDKVYDQISPTAPDCLALVQRLPLGVVTAIVPWNFPVNLSFMPLTFAFAAGNRDMAGYVGAGFFRDHRTDICRQCPRISETQFVHCPIQHL